MSGGYRATLRPRRDSVLFPWETSLVDSRGNLVARSIHETFFFARLRHRRLKRIARKLNSIDGASSSVSEEVR